MDPTTQGRQGDGRHVLCPLKINTGIKKALSAQPACCGSYELNSRMIF
jgi:hypothetical protein